MGNVRLERVNGLIQEVVSGIVRELKDPRVGFVTVTGVETTPDLQHATVFVSILGDAAAHKTTMEGLQSAAGLVRRRMGGQIRLRYTPDIHFRFDPSLERGIHMMELLKTIDDGGPAPAAGEDPA